MIDFREIGDFERFQDLVAEILKRQPGIHRVEQTGRGSDSEADIKVSMKRITDPVTLTEQELQGIVECKHFARSGRSVRKNDIHPSDTLTVHDADVYLLVTSTRVGTFYGDVIEQISRDKRHRQQYAACWDCSHLEGELLKPENEDLLMRFFPRSGKAVLDDRQARAKIFDSQKSQLSRESTLPEIVSTEDKTNQENTHMRKAYVITGMAATEPINSGALRYLARGLGVTVSTSSDASLESILMLETAVSHRERLASVNAVFALVTKNSSVEPNVWIEIERAESLGKLKAVFIDESAYEMRFMSNYPCVLLRRTFEQSVQAYVTYFRTIFQSELEQPDTWFWFGLAILTAYFRLPSRKPKKRREEAVL